MIMKFNDFHENVTAIQKALATGVLSGH
jgi:hypothetical protein